MPAWSSFSMEEWAWLLEEIQRRRPRDLTCRVGGCWGRMLLGRCVRCGAKARC